MQYNTQSTTTNFGALMPQDATNIALVTCVPGRAQEMLYVIAGALGMDYSCYQVRSRTRDIVELRFIAAMMMRSYFPVVRLQQIAAMFGGQDHTSVMNGIMRAYELIHVKDERFIGKYSRASKVVEHWFNGETPAAGGVQKSLVNHGKAAA